MNARPLVLLTNDDGHQAEGLHALQLAFSRVADVLVVAPEAEQSTTSHSLSLHRPLRLRPVDNGIFAVDGTPADCVYMALHEATGLLPRRPDLVVSGLNHGSNLGTDVFYSGTVGAAREGALRGIPALATSADLGAARPAAAALTVSVAMALLDLALTGRPANLWNLNIPSGKGPWPLLATTLGIRIYDEEVTVRKDPRGRDYFWIGGKGVFHLDRPGSDTAAFDAGAASLTPLLLDLTAREQQAITSDVVRAVTEGSAA